MLKLFSSPMKMGVLLIPLCIFLSFLNPTQAEEKTVHVDELTKAADFLAAGQYEQAFPEYLRVAEHTQNPLAQFSLALFFQNGWGRPPDMVAACEWYTKAAEGGIPVAQHQVAECLVHGLHRPADAVEAALWYTKAAEHGHHPSLCSLAQLYMTGTGVIKDPAKALNLCQQSAQLGNRPAQLQLARWYKNGETTIQDIDAAFFWFQQAANQQEPEAQYELGKMLREGLGSPPDVLTAREWFETAASQGYVPAYFPTGDLYFHAQPDPQTNKLTAEDLAKAYLWLSATTRRSQREDELEKSRVWLSQINVIMPESWRPALDAKIAEHLHTYATAQEPPDRLKPKN